MDIIFFVDGSNSLQRESFNLGKQVVTNFIEEHGVESYRYSVVSYCNKLSFGNKLYVGYKKLNVRIATDTLTIDKSVKSRIAEVCIFLSL